MCDFISCKTRKTAFKRMPWASWIVKVCGGYMGFEYFDDYINFIDHMCKRS